MIELISIPGKHEQRKVGNKQQRPYHRPLPYVRFDAREHRSGVMTKIPIDDWPIIYGDRFYPGAIYLPSLSDRHALLRDGYDMSTIEKALYFNDLAKARNKALAKIDDDLTQVANLFEDWYERKQSIALLTNVGKELLTFATSWRKPQYWKRVAGKAKQPTSLPEAWITYQFGVKPLVGSVDTILNNLARPLADAKFSQTSGCKNSRHNSRKSGGDRPNLYNQVDISYRYTLGCFVKSNQNPNLGLINVAGLGMPFSSAWNVIPWGWAVDYFVNVGQLLTNIENKHPGVQVHDWWSTEKWDITEERKWIQSDDLFMDSSFESHEMIRRTPISVPRYHATFDFPLLGSNKLANLFSALAMTMKKG